MTSWGGIYCNKNGDLRKRWSWLGNKYHVHAPPCQPFSLTLGPNLSIFFKSQEHVSVSFTSGKCGIQLNVGAKLNMSQGKSLMVSRPDMLQSYLKKKSAEINVLLQNIQSLTTYQKTISPWKVKSQQSFISQMERRQLPAKQELAAKKSP
ncbi:glutamate-rich protein 6B-like [Menidia menidia]